MASNTRVATSSAYSCLITIAHVGCGTTTSRPAAASATMFWRAAAAKCSRSPLCNHGAPQHVVSSTSVQSIPLRS